MFKVYIIIRDHQNQYMLYFYTECTILGKELKFIANIFYLVII